MKKLTIILLLVPILSFGQIFKSEDYGDIDIRDVKDKYISVELGGAWHSLTTSKYREVELSADIRERKWNVYDEGELTTLYSQIDVLNFFDKYGWKLVKTDEENKGAYTNYYNNLNMALTFSSTSTTLVFTRE
tara:strand:+ start:146 stop:544 length:399 start_codon:yes stop_codon:yes gene_type:complete